MESEKHACTNHAAKFESLKIVDDYYGDEECYHRTCSKTAHRIVEL